MNPIPAPRTIIREGLAGSDPRTKPRKAGPLIQPDGSASWDSRFSLRPMLLGLMLLCLGLAGCATPSARWQGPDQASVVLHHNSWDCIFMTKPSCQEGPFLRQIRRAELSEVFDQFQVQRQTAVVSLSWDYQARMLEDIVGEWQAELAQCGFERVVFVRSRSDLSVRRAIIIRDCPLALPSVRPQDFALISP